MTSEQEKTAIATPNQSRNTPSPELPTPEEKKTKFWRQIRENFQVVAIALTLAIALRIFIAEPRYIPSDSMLPTLEIGDRLVIEKVSYRFDSPHQGDVIVFIPPQQLQIQGYSKQQAFIKRVIGESGQTVAVENGTVYVNDIPLVEEYIAEPPHYSLKAVTVPEDYLFVMGDNRNNSNDSHVWGFLPKNNVIGRAVIRFYPFDRLGEV